MELSIGEYYLRLLKEPVFRTHWYLNRKVLSRDGVRLMEKDWDNLVILDGCRYDVFNEYATLQGSLTRRISRGSHTTEFLQRNFSEETYADTVYVSATPQLWANDLQTRFHASVPLWKLKWNPESNTVLPTDAIDVALNYVEEYPNKRIIVHLIQPHYPFIGPTGQEIAHRTVTGDGLITNDHSDRSIWDKLRSGEIKCEVVRQAYVENLVLALPEVERFMSSVTGKTVVTSDHGNAFGRLGIFGHPQRKFIADLVEVPWLVDSSGERRDICSGRVDRTTDMSQDGVETRLRDLGYVR